MSRVYTLLSFKDKNTTDTLTELILLYIFPIEYVLKIRFQGLFLTANFGWAMKNKLFFLPILSADI